MNTLILGLLLLTAGPRGRDGIQKIASSLAIASHTTVDMRTGSSATTAAIQEKLSQFSKRGSNGTSLKTENLPNQTVMLLSCSPGQTSVVYDNRAPEPLADDKKKEPMADKDAANVSGSESSKSYISKSTGIEFVLIQAGTFMMGSPESELSYSRKHEKDENQHQATISKPYYLGKYEVTQSEFETVMGFNPSRYGTDVISPSGELPVESVTWFDAVMFCNKLSEKDGRTAAYSISDIQLEDGKKNIKSATVSLVPGADGYRLPTEAEWEYACRAGTTTSFNTGVNLPDDQANINRKTNSTMPAKSFKPNAFGLHNMHGNVWEWCWDFYANYDTTALHDPQGAAQGSDRVGRGGGWNAAPVGCRSAFRDWLTPDGRSFDLGFRVSLQSAR